MQCILQLEVVLVTVFILFSVSARKLDSNGLQVNDTDILIVHLGNAADLLLNPTSGEQFSYDKFWGDAVKYGEMELEVLKTELMEMEEMEAKEHLGGHTMELEDTWSEELKTELLEKEEMETKRKLSGRRMKSQSSKDRFRSTFTTSGLVCSPNYPAQYGNYGNKVWVINAPEGSQIVLSFMAFDLERNYDFLYIRDGNTATSTLLHKLTGDEHFADVVSSGNHLHITFTSDYSVTKTGFYSSWQFKRPSLIHWVVQVAPKLRFDSKFGSGNKCFPSSAESYYITRASGNNNRICNTDYNTMTSKVVPTYWRAMECGDDLNIAFWFFTGYQDTCSPGEGSHDSDWEHIVVKITDYKTANKLGPVQFYQHTGWYTKNPGHYSREGVHPIVYSGKNSHGSYHDDGGSGGCCYFEDFRNPGSKNQYMNTWENLEELRRTDSAPSFMKDRSSVDMFGIPSPLDRPETYEMCMIPGCKGSRVQICHTCGCAKSHVNAGAFF